MLLLFSYLRTANVFSFCEKSQKDKKHDKKEKRRKEFSAATYSPTGTPRSTIGAGGLNFRVRHGTGCVPSAMTTENFPLLWCFS